jgi:biotin carboxylase
MIMQVLGGGSAQLGIIRRLKELGHTVVVSDYLPDAPGKRLADHCDGASTFDLEATLRCARRYAVEGILTIGTDQPVYTAAVTARELGLPYFLTPEQALTVTHKRHMKELFLRHGIPTVRWVCVSQEFSDTDLDHLRPPYVMKPLDSQGQRGIFKLDTTAQLREHLLETLSFSRDDQVLIEEYYPHDELTLSGWVHDRKLTVLTITDRITRDTPPSIGVCFAHRYPSRHAHESEQITAIAEEVVSAIGMREGPLYLQLLKGAQGYLVNETACRIGGAYEEYTIPAVTDVPILDLQIELAAGGDPDPRRWFDQDSAAAAAALVLLFFIREGTVGTVGDPDELLSLPGVLSGAYHVREGHQSTSIGNASQRAGYVVLAAKDTAALQQSLEQVLSCLTVLDREGRDMILPYKESL